LDNKASDNIDAWCSREDYTLIFYKSKIK